MPQRNLVVANLPLASLDASAAFFADHLDKVRGILGDDETSALAIVLPHAGADHDDWRCALALDLAREYAPKRVNIVRASDPSSAEPLLAYLRDAPGVTGQYLQAHG